MIRIPFPRRILFTSMVAGALAFGGSQAFAAPDPPQKVGWCVEEECAQWCGGYGYCADSGRQCICM